MIGKPIRPRELARKDIEDAVDWYAREATADIALGFIDALQSAYGLIAENPGAGSPRYGIALDLPGLRSTILGRFPYAVFYVERNDHIEVWRVLHLRRDIPASMRSDR